MILLFFFFRQSRIQTHPVQYQAVRQVEVMAQRLDAGESQRAE